MFSLRSGTRPGCSLSPILFNTVLVVLATAIRQEEEIKGIHIRKEDMRLCFAGDMKLCREKHKDSTRNLPELISELSKLAKYKINIQKLVAFYTPIINYQKEKLR